MASEEDLIAQIQNPNIEDTAKLTRLLQNAGIPSALWGVNAAACYGGGLCALDIELVVNDIDHAKIFETLRSYGCRPSQPSSDGVTPCPNDFGKWRELSLHYQYLDRRNVRLNTPIYEFPETGDPLTDFLRPFVIVYSAEVLGLPEIPPLSEVPTFIDDKEGEVDEVDYVRVIDLPYHILGDEESKSSLLAPEMRLLIQSEIHVILQHASSTAIWGQHMAQLSELMRSPGCKKGCDSVHEIVKPSQVRFAHWFQLYMEGNGDKETLQNIRDEYSHADQKSQ